MDGELVELREKVCFHQLAKLAKDGAKGRETCTASHRACSDASLRLSETRAMDPTGGLMKALALKLMGFYERQGEKITWERGYLGLMI